MTKLVCIHGHFYQPPRENPWLETIEVQDSAAPYHDWNERITAECYGPNAASRILDQDAFIVKIVNNYSRISFNFGPTLLAWMEHGAPEVYRSVLEADRDSRGRFSGHGSAIAQAYNHMILPLANRRDKETQILWGIKDFEHRFGRFPEGMWLPETAVDLETLDLLAEHGLRFTLLAPHQARRIKRGPDWEDVSGGKVDPKIPYHVACPSGRRLAVFFYDGPVSRAVAFERLLQSGEAFSARLEGAFEEGRETPQLMHIATDGETYGHHHRFGDMALAYALQRLDAHDGLRLTNYGEFLERHPPAAEAEIFENTSWSCAHGVERWRSDCGCNGGRQGWNQSWRGPLREALDWLRDRLIPVYEQKASEFFKDPWEARNRYVAVILDRSDPVPSRFLETETHRALSAEDRVTAFKLMELQRHAQLMYTSCGWFFDDLSGIETVQVLHYAARVLQLARDLFGHAGDWESGFLQRLAKAKSNVPEHGDGAAIFDRLVRPAEVDLQKVAAHYAVSSLFENYGDPVTVYRYRIEKERYRSLDDGKTRLAVGSVRVLSEITGEEGRYSFGVLHLGDHHLSGGVRPLTEGDKDQAENELAEAFSRADFTGAFRVLDDRFRAPSFSLRALFGNEQRKILAKIFEPWLYETDLYYHQIYQKLEYALEKKVETLVRDWAGDLRDIARIGALETAIRDAAKLPFPLRLWTAQNVYYRAFQDAFPGTDDPEWRRAFQSLGEVLRVRILP